MKISHCGEILIESTNCSYTNSAFREEVDCDKQRAYPDVGF